MRLCRQSAIELTRAQGARYRAWPLRAQVLREEGLAHTQVLIWAPKSQHKHAVDRNTLRRRMREAYRHLSTPLKQLEEQGITLQIMIYYISTEMNSQAEINHAMQKLIKLIVDSSSGQLTNDN